MSRGESDTAGRQPDGQAVLERGRVRRAAIGPGGDQARRPRKSFRYPDGGADRLRAAIGKRWGLDPARIVCGAGSDDLLYQFCLSYGGPGRDIIMSAHGFTIYHIAGTLCRQPGDQGAGAQPDRRPGRDAGGGLAGDHGWCSWPTRTTRPGRWSPRPRVARFRAALAARGAAGARFRLCRIRHARRLRRRACRLVDATDNTVMTRTFSKIFGLGGMRIGWCYGAARRGRRAEPGPRRRSTSRSPRRRPAIAALAEPGWVEKGRAHNAE